MSLLARDRKSGISEILLHGRLDLGSPLDTAWELAGAWPDARLIVVDAGPAGSNAMRDQICTGRPSI
jgi:proline iminopeptidase